MSKSALYARNQSDPNRDRRSHQASRIEFNNRGNQNGNMDNDNNENSDNTETNKSSKDKLPILIARTSRSMSRTRIHEILLEALHRRRLDNQFQCKLYNYEAARIPTIIYFPSPKHRTCANTIDYVPAKKQFRRSAHKAAHSSVALVHRQLVPSETHNTLRICF
jgi:hypothetical protein